MDTALLVTFKSVLDSMQLRCKGDTTSASDEEKTLMAEYLTEAAGWAWKFPQRPWPVMMEPATVTLSGGVILWKDISYANWWEVYQTDPRPLPRTEWPCLVRCRRDATGLWPEYNLQSPDSSPAELFVRFQRRAPEFTTTQYSSTTYQIGDVIYDGASGKTGNCFRALAVNTNPDDAQLADTTKWERQEIPRFLKEAILQYARGGWMQDQTQEDKVPNYRRMALEALENEWFNQQEEN